VQPTVFAAEAQHRVASPDPEVPHVADCEDVTARWMHLLNRELYPRGASSDRS
jgi:hypothetical protein